MSELADKPRKKQPPVAYQWKPGQSGNPAGRTGKSLTELRAAHERARCLTVEAVEYWAAVLRDEKAAPEARNKAAENLCDRGGLVRGFALQTDADGPLAGATSDERAAVLQRQAAMLLDAVRAERATIVTSAVSEPVPTTDRASEGASGPHSATPEAP